MKNTLFIVTIIVGVLIMIAIVWYTNTSTHQVATPQPQPTPSQEHCGGNIRNPHQCGPGFHCASAPGSTLPFGDVGGLCVAD